jgi:hypothetical protein
MLRGEGRRQRAEGDKKEAKRLENVKTINIVIQMGEIQFTSGKQAGRLWVGSISI